MSRILVNGFDFDPLAGPPVLPPGLKHEPGADDTLHYYIVQLDRRVTPSMKRDITGSGATILYYINYNAFLVAADAEAVHRIDAIPFVRWRGPFEPAYKLSPRLSLDYDRVVNDMLARAASDDWKPPKVDTQVSIPVEIQTMESSRVPEVERTLRSHGATASGRSLEHGGTIQAEVPRSALEMLAREPGVLWIDRKVPDYFLNDVASWTIQSNTPVLRPVHDHQILGTGQTVTLADSGLDYQHEAFEDPLVPLPGPAHRKVTAYYVPQGQGAQGDSSDQLTNHGTHVAGTIAGDAGAWHFYDGDGFVDPNDDVVEAVGPHDGQAFDAKLQVQDIGPANGGVRPPNDLTNLYTPARNANSWIHTNSWGTDCCGEYTTQEMQTDEFVWNNENFLVVFSAGNGGPGSRNVNPRGSAKNVIAVGASGNGPLANNLAAGSNGVYFSGRGPTRDGRLKPDLVAPGQDIWSARGCDPDPPCDDYRKASGTSMAAPMVAGAAALVRQYYMDGWYPSGAPQASDGFTPSAALIKATLINGGVEMTGQSTGANDDDGFPSMNQGWGRVQLDRVLHFTGSPRTLQVHDETSGVGTGEVASHQFSVGDTTEPLEVTLVWSDHAAAPFIYPSLVNDLDLVVTAPDGTNYRGNHFVKTLPRQSRGLAAVEEADPDVLNNVEAVMVVTGVQVGVWSIQVSGRNVPMGKGALGRQPYALVVTGGGASRRAAIDIRGDIQRPGVSVPITLVDSDLNANPAAMELVSVSLSSDTETVPESIVLEEAGTNSPVFTGQVLLQAGSAPVPNDGRLEVQDGDWIVASHYDADDGQGGSGLRTDSAQVDDVPPAITGVQIGAVGPTTATIFWSTTEPAASIVHYGPAVPPASTSAEPDRVGSHAITLKNLLSSTTYYFSVASTDEAGNTSIDDNGSIYYQFTTLVQPGDERDAEWPMFQNNPRRQGSSPSRLSPPLTPLWSSSPVANGRSRGPVMAGGRLFSTTNDGYVRARDAFTGGLLWEHQLGDVSVSSTPSMPMVNDGIVYQAVVSFGTGYLYALDPATGATLWTSEPVLVDVAPFFAPSASGNRVIVADKSNGRIVALNASDGSVAWTSPTIGSLGVGAAIEPDRILVGTLAGMVLALSDLDGQILWSRTLDGAVASVPLVVNGRVYVGTDKPTTSTGSFYALDDYTGNVLWQVTGFGRISSTASYDGSSLYFSSTNILNSLRNDYHALRASDGKILWQRSLHSSGWQGSLAHAFHSLFGLASDGILRALDDETGLIIESIPLGSTCGDPTSPSCFAMSPAVAAGKVWVSDGSGAIHAYQAQLADEDLDGDPDDLDCAPVDGAVFHGAAEVCNGADDDCDGTVDDGFANFDGDSMADCVDPDDDNDGDADATDCAFHNPDIGHYATEGLQQFGGLPGVCEDSVDNDCDLIVDANEELCSAYGVLPSSDYPPEPGDPGVIWSGNYLSTYDSDDGYEVLRETLDSHGKSKLTHTWRFYGVPPGSHSLRVEAHRDSMAEDDFQFYWSDDNVHYHAISGALINKPMEIQGGGQVYSFGASDSYPTIYIRVKDTAAGTVLDKLFVDFLAVVTEQ